MTNSKPTNEVEFENLDPLSVRTKAGLNLTEMAHLMGMSEAGYETWEDGTRQPGGPAYKLLFLLDNNPDAIVAQLGTRKTNTGVIEN
ncbi:hypothetical protein [uncultured Shimia sp.]|uniref:helix-turn-helix domain-containing protein n=1 Tax=uncultured Shimia sp. TaxID=573152 RepID=UPI00260F0941|nr:hypothetical protein [uncultured Shimia sp.]